MFLSIVSISKLYMYSSKLKKILSALNLCVEQTVVFISIMLLSELTNIFSELTDKFIKLKVVAKELVVLQYIGKL